MPVLAPRALSLQLLYGLYSSVLTFGKDDILGSGARAHELWTPWRHRLTIHPDRPKHPNRLHTRYPRNQVRASEISLDGCIDLIRAVYNTVWPQHQELSPKAHGDTLWQEAGGSGYVHTFHGELLGKCRSFHLQSCEVDSVR